MDIPIVRRIAPGILSLLLCSVAVACSEEKKTVEEYGETLTGAIPRAKQAQTASDLRTVQQAVQAFYAEQGHYPDRLEDLPLVQDQRLDVSRFAYNSTTGSVSWKE